jgi:hypothetical protein
MVYCLNTRQSPIFLIAGIMELPTFDLAISNLFPVLRNDLRFLSTFFLIRLAFHLVYFFDCVRPASRQLMGGAWTPAVMLLLAFAMHASWFHGGVVGYLKRQSKARAEAESLDTPMSSAALLSGTPNRRFASFGSSSDLSTPDDSPLVTPHTPRTLPILSLPSMPHMPNLSGMPTVSIPSFSDLTAALHAREQAYGFKEAVKNRWGEQRDRFAGMRRGGGMGMNFGGLNLRRRGGAEGGEEVDAESRLD